MTDALTSTESNTALTAKEIRAQVNLIQEVMRDVMKKDTHYGVVPGCGNKPTLLKAGAEKIMLTFRLAADPQVQEIPTDDGITFRVICRILNWSGVFVGAGVGECSTKEDKYNWRAAVSEKEFDTTPEDRRRIKYSRTGETKQVRTNPHDLANTVLKMGKKRALVDGVLTATGASDIFTQDIEDMPEEVVNGGKAKSAPTQPQAQGAGKKITENQKKLIYAKCKNSASGVTEDAIKTRFSVGNIADLPMDAMNDVLAYIDNPTNGQESEQGHDDG